MLVDLNFQDAEQFLLALDPTADCFTFQTFDDLKDRRDPYLARIVHGGLAEVAALLASLNARGAGVFTCINATDLKGRSLGHITRIRAIWQDDDHGCMANSRSCRRLLSVHLRGDSSGFGFATI